MGLVYFDRNTLVSVTVTSATEIPDFPEFGRAADFGSAKPETPDYRRLVSFDLHEILPERLIEALRKRHIRPAKFAVRVHYQRDYWKQRPDDCLGGILQADGTVSTRDWKDYWRLIPLDEPLTIVGRPTNELESGGRGAVNLVHAGGIPIVSHRLLCTLQDLGAEGATADVIYEGFNRKAAGRPQPGFQRFLIEPAFPIRDKAINALPAQVPRDFRVASLLSSRLVRYPEIREERRYEIALSSESCDELRRSIRSMEFAPLFDPDGPNHRWLCEFEEQLQAMVDSSKEPDT